MLVEVGRVCIKTAGHEAMQKCVVVDNAGENFVIIAGPRVKKRKCNIKHLDILPHTVNIKKGAADAEVIDALLKAGLVSEKDLQKKPSSSYTPKQRSEGKKQEVKAREEKPAADEKAKKPRLIKAAAKEKK